MDRTRYDAKVAVVGGRDFNDYAYMKKVLDSYRNKFGIGFIISGGARGADTLAERYAKENEISFTVFLPKWSVEGKRAGFRRNILIVECCDVVIAFPSENSRGTYHTIETAKKFDKPVYVFKG